MQASEVVDLLLDFTAMEFVASLDDAAFALSLRGFLGRAMKKTAKTVKRARYTPRDKRLWLRKWPMFLVLIFLFTCYMIVRVSQDNRAFGDNEIVVQLHDDAIPWLSTLSGSYIGCSISISDRNDRDIGPIIYSKLPVKGCKKNWKKEQAVFFFCDDEHWVFAVGDDMNQPCNKWTMKSYKSDASKTDAYDILTHASESWFAKDLNGIAEEGVLESIGILGSFVLADPAGSECDILKSEGVAFPIPLYNRLKNVAVSGRPVFYADDESLGEYVFFDGRRWIIVNERDLHLDCLPDCGTQANSTSCKVDCLQTFDPFASNYTVRLISDPMDLRTTSDTWIPTDALTWYQATGSGSSSTPNIGRASQAETIQKVQALLEVVALKQATPEELAEAEALFTQSSSLGCQCQATDDACKQQNECPGGSSLLIDLNTDSYGNETSFFLLDIDSYNIYEQEAADVVDFDEWLDQSIGLEGLDFLNNTGFFSWRNARSIPLKSMSRYRYQTCMPQDSCAMLSFQDSFGDGIYFPGGFNVFLDGQRIPTDFSTLIAHCLYRFGPACEQSVNCSSSGPVSQAFNPDVECTAGSPLAFQVVTDKNPLDNSLVLVDIDSWDENQGQNTQVLNETGQFPFQNVVVNFTDAETTYRFTTCIPEDTCALLVFKDSFGDGILGGGGISVAYNNEDLSLANETVSFSYCQFQFGSCEQEAFCRD
jgi:hypothetical protein